MTTTESGDRRVACLLKRYPRLSETFILHEILELERQGVELCLFSLLEREQGCWRAEGAGVSTERRRPCQSQFQSPPAAS